MIWTPLTKYLLNSEEKLDLERILQIASAMTDPNYPEPNCFGYVDTSASSDPPRCHVPFRAAVLQYHSPLW